MFTKNYINLRKAWFVGLSSTLTHCQGATFTGGQSTVSYQSIELGYCLGRFATGELPTTYGSSVGQSWAGVRFGTGSTPFTKDDYTLSAPIVSGLSADVGKVLVYKDEDGKYIAENSFIVTNTSADEINIREAGIYAPVGTNSTNQYYCTLMDRIVLDAPISLMPGDEKLITYRITFNQT